MKNMGLKYSLFLAISFPLISWGEDPLNTVTDPVMIEYTNAFKTGEYSKLKELLKKGCDDGIIDHCYKLAVIVSKDDAESANKYFRIACQGSHQSACTELLRNKNTKGNIDLALKSLQEKCNGNSIESCYSLGIAEHRIGRFKEAAEAFTIACDQNNWTACFSLAGCYAKLNDKNSALKYLNKACAGGFREACGGENHYIVRGD